mmetsp:Transcript_32856/g.53317  ORF Transcript_32856/g.53317 Transcript_32856/m.53317 type:complete len:331 (+) Transcript_32856:550-1542(+)
MWHGDKGLQTTMEMILVATEALGAGTGPVAVQRGILRPALSRRQEKDFRKAGLPVDDSVVAKLAQDPFWGDASNDQDLLWLEPSQAESLVGCALGPNALGGLFIRSGAMVHPTSYMKGLWNACKQTGRAASLHTEKLDSESIKRFDVIVFCGGAFTNDMLSSLGIDACLPLQTVKGHTVEFILPSSTVASQSVPTVSLISGAYIGMHPSRVFCGATFEPVFESIEADPLKAMDELIPHLSAVLPVVGETWVNEFPFDIKTGLRAIPPRLLVSGTTPIAGPIDTNVWVFAGLGSRGLLHHGWIGQCLADAILSNDASLLPKELTVHLPGKG